MACEDGCTSVQDQLRKMGKVQVHKRMRINIDYLWEMELRIENGESLFPDM